MGRDSSGAGHHAMRRGPQRDVLNLKPGRFMQD